MEDYEESPDPEEERLEREEAEEIYWEIERKKQGKLETKIKYQEFYNEAKRFNLDIGESSYEKSKLLIKYFPGKFGDNSKTPIRKMEDIKIGSIFKRLVNYSKRRKEQ